MFSHSPWTQNGDSECPRTTYHSSSWIPLLEHGSCSHEEDKTATLSCSNTSDDFSLNKSLPRMWGLLHSRSNLPPQILQLFWNLIPPQAQATPACLLLSKNELITLLILWLISNCFLEHHCLCWSPWGRLFLKIHLRFNLWSKFLSVHSLPLLPSPNTPHPHHSLL